MILLMHSIRITHLCTEKYYKVQGDTQPSCWYNPLVPALNYAQMLTQVFLGRRA